MTQRIEAIGRAVDVACEECPTHSALMRLYDSLRLAQDDNGTLASFQRCTRYLERSAELLPANCPGTRQAIRNAIRAF
jgi:hypothetical protein